MIVDFECDDITIVSTNLYYTPKENETVTIFGKEYVVTTYYHDVEIDTLGTHEKMICVVEEKE